MTPECTQLLMEGITHQRSGDLARAQACYESLLEREPTSTSALNNLGFLRAQRGDYEGSLELYERAIARGDPSAALLSNRGVSLAAIGRSDEALQSAREATRVEPGDATAWDTLAKLEWLHGAPESAGRAWTRLLELAPDSGEALRGLGGLCAARGDRDGALAYLERAVAANADDLEAWSQIGALLLLRQDFGSARRALQRVLDRAPEDLRARRHLAMAALGCGRPDEAESHLKVALHLDAGDVESATDLATLWLAGGRPEAARSLLDQILQRRPDHERARRARAVLGSLASPDQRSTTSH